MQLWDRNQQFVTSINPQFLFNDASKEKVVFSYAIKLSQGHLDELLPYSNVLDFEPYRNKGVFSDEDWPTYRDEYDLTFTGFSDSYYFLLEIDMKIIHNEYNAWPTERLYKFLVTRFLLKNKKLRKRVRL